jgi:hypothetical protein
MESVTMRPPKMRTCLIERAGLMVELLMYGFICFKKVYAKGWPVRG